MKRFRGWEPATVHTYDGDRLVSSRPEAEWDATEQGWMLALRAYRQGRCPGCGGDLAVTTASENEGRFRAELPVQCFRCLAFSRSHEAYEGEQHPRSLLHLVSQRPN